MPDEELDSVGAVFEHLKNVGDRKFGYGWKEMVNRRLKRATGYVTRDMTKRSMRLATLLEVLDILEEDPGHFFAQLFGVGRGEDRSQVATDSIRLEPSIARIIKDLQFDEGIVRADFQSPVISGILDRKASSPRVAIEMTLAALVLVSNSGLPKNLAFPLLMEWSTLQASVDNLSQARSGYQLILREAGVTKNWHVRAEALLRSATVDFKQTGQPSIALRTVENAMLAFIDLGDANGVGQSLVKRAWYLHYLGRSESALHSLKIALDLLIDDDTFVALAYHWLGFLKAESGNYEEAKIHLEEAAHRSANQPKARASIEWVIGSIAGRSGDYEAAVKALESARNQLHPQSPVEYVLVSLDLADLHLQNGRPSAARRVTQDLSSLLDPLVTYPEIQAVLMNLLRVAISAESLSSLILEETSQEIRRIGNAYRGATMSY